jgi:hypothetical protein
MRPPLNARTLVSPRRTGQLLFAPHAPEDRTIARLGVARSVAGIAVYAAVVSQKDLNNLLIAGSQPLVTGVRTLYLGPVIVAVVVLVAPLFLNRNRREAYGAALSGPLLRILLAIFIMGLVVLDNRYGLGRVQHWPNPGNLSDTNPRWSTVLDATLKRLALELVYIWLGVYVVCALYYMNRNMFNAADVDPQLTPIAASLFVWALVVYDSSPALQRVVPQLHMGEPVPMSSNALRAVVSIGGAVTVTALASWELARIRRYTAAEAYSAMPTGLGRPGQALHRRPNLP